MTGLRKQKLVMGISSIVLLIFGLVYGAIHHHLQKKINTIPAVWNIIPSSDSVAVYDKYEVQFDLAATFDNPFDPDQVDIKAIFSLPGGTTSTTFGFWYQSFQMANGIDTVETYSSISSPHWMVRFTPPVAGNYTYTIQVNSIYGNSISTTLSFTASPSVNNGFIRIHRNNYHYFQFDRGGVYYPIGQNLAGSSPGTHPTMDGVTSAQFYHSRLAASKVNWIRFWMTNLHHNAIEWTGSGYSGLGRYALDRGYRIDKILESAQANNIYVQLTLLDYRQVSNWADIYWPQSPYNSVNGGPVPAASPQAFFSNITARAIYKKQLRYIVARWGYLPNIFAWEHFNEVEYTGDSNQNVFINSTVKNDIINWHQEMASYLKAIDPNHHLVTTSSDDPWYGKYGYYSYSLFSSLWAIPQIDITQTHIYTYAIESDIIQQTRYFQNTFPKPNLIAEYGIQNIPEYSNDSGASIPANGFDPTNFKGSTAQRDHLLEGTHIHNALWTALMNQSLSGFWWWDYYMEADTTRHRTAPQFPLYYHYVPLDAFLKTTMNPTRYPMEDFPNYGLSFANMYYSSSIRACGLSNSERAYIWFRDKDNDYFSGAEPGDMVNRTISNATLTITGLNPNTLFGVQYFDTYNSGGPIGSLQQIQSTSLGSLTIPIPVFQRDRAVKILQLSTVAFVPTKHWLKYK